MGQMMSWFSGRKSKGDRRRDAASQSQTYDQTTHKEHEPRTKECSRTVSMEDLREDDIVIVVMGSTGSGKSTFVDRASGQGESVGHGLTPHTREVNAVRFRVRENGRFVVLVDTPGFDDLFKTDLDILNMISKWLRKSYKRDKVLSAILYLHRINDNRMGGTLLKNLRMFQNLCGNDALDKVYFTTTMWDEVEERVGEEVLEELKSKYWKTMIDLGANAVRCRNDDESPKRLIREIVEKGDNRGVRFQRQMESMAEKVKQKPHFQMEELLERQAEIRRITESKRADLDPEVLSKLRELEREIAIMTRQIKEENLAC